MTAPRPAAFLDRDGTIIRDVGYISDPDAVELLPGVVEGLRALAGAGYALVIITNQSGLARGFFHEDDYRAVQARALELLAVQGVRITASYHCPHHPGITGPCDCRKPRHALYRQAARDHDLDLARSVYIGDKVSDVQPGIDFGGRAILVRTGYGKEEAEHAPGGVEQQDDLRSAASAVLDRRGVDTPGAGP